jgi:hypothetical protein
MHAEEKAETKKVPTEFNIYRSILSGRAVSSEHLAVTSLAHGGGTALPG